MSTNTQTDSAFINRLPREIREAIYVELWRSHGLRQHILYHSDPQANPWELVAPDVKNYHFCHWPCATEFEVRDRLQEALEELRSQIGVPLGQDIITHRFEVKTSYVKRLQSPWMNHWPCGELAHHKYGIKALEGFATGDQCWKKTDKADGGTCWSSPYIPMLLSCKLM